MHLSSSFVAKDEAFLSKQMHNIYSERRNTEDDETRTTLISGPRFRLERATFFLIAIF